MGRGIEIAGVIYKDNEEDLGWEELIDLIESAGLNLGGSMIPVDEEGERIELSKEEIKELEEEQDE